MHRHKVCDNAKGMDSVIFGHGFRSVARIGRMKIRTTSENATALLCIDLTADDEGEVVIISEACQPKPGLHNLPTSTSDHRSIASPYATQRRKQKDDLTDETLKSAQKPEKIDGKPGRNKN